jgi:cell wall assembly regulator SMI1
MSTNASDKQMTAMFDAVEKGDLAALKKLLADGVDPDVRSRWNLTPLIPAAETGHEDIFFALVDAGADLHATRGHGDSVLLKAVKGKEPARLRMVEAIIAAGGLGPDDSLPNAFAYACQSSSVEIVRALLAAGADPNHKYLPLWLAVRSNRPEIAAELIKVGADVNVRVPQEQLRDNKHARKTFIEAAIDEGFTEVAKLLEAAGAKTPSKKATAKRSENPTPVADSWKRIAKWLKDNASGFKPLKKGVAAGEFAAAEKELGFKLPAELRESYRAYSGDDSRQIFPCSDGISFYLMPFETVVREWKMMKELADLGEFNDIDGRVKNDKEIRRTWWNANWIPFAGNGGGDYFCVDLDPAEGGTKGQVIHFRHDAEDRTLLSRSLRGFLYELANGLDDGKYRYEESGIA